MRLRARVRAPRVLCSWCRHVRPSVHGNRHGSRSLVRSVPVEEALLYATRQRRRPVGLSATITHGAKGTGTCLGIAYKAEVNDEIVQLMLDAEGLKRIASKDQVRTVVEEESVREKEWSNVEEPEGEPGGP